MHFILVHGACHGQWCWYKLKPLIEGSGHRVTALDLSASGTNLQKIEDLKTMKDYTDPLLQVLGSLPAEEKVGIMGHSLGGLNLAVAMETFPEKILVAIFLSAFLPDTTHEPSFVVNQLLPTDADLWLDTKFSSYHVEEGDQLVTKFLFGPKFMALLYDSCPNEDLELAMMLKRPSSFFLHDLSKAKKLSVEKFGSVRKVYIICKDDKGIAEKFQRWMIENNGGVEEVKELDGSDHMPMLSMPQKLTDCLVGIAEHYLNHDEVRSSCLRPQ